MFRLFRWSRDFHYTKESTVVPVWVKLPQLPLLYFNPAYLQRIGNSIGSFLRVDEKSRCRTSCMLESVLKWMCHNLLQYQIWIDESKESGFWQRIEYEGNNAFCTNCGLLGHVSGVCRKNIKNKPAGKEMSHKPVPILKRKKRNWRNIWNKRSGKGGYSQSQ